jgi:hypothetical protein
MDFAVKKLKQIELQIINYADKGFVRRIKWVGESHCYFFRSFTILLLLLVAGQTERNRGIRD